MKKDTAGRTAIAGLLDAREELPLLSHSSAKVQNRVAVRHRNRSRLRVTALCAAPAMLLVSFFGLSQRTPAVVEAGASSAQVVSASTSVANEGDDVRDLYEVPELPSSLECAGPASSVVGEFPDTVVNPSDSAMSAEGAIETFMSDSNPEWRLRADWQDLDLKGTSSSDERVTAYYMDGDRPYLIVTATRFSWGWGISKVRSCSDLFRGVER